VYHSTLYYLCICEIYVFLRELGDVPDVLSVIVEEWIIYDIKLPILADSLLLTCYLNDSRNTLCNSPALCHLIATNSLLVRTGLRKLSARDKQVDIAFFVVGLS